MKQIMNIRLLSSDDYYREYLPLLNQLTPTHTPTYSEFCARLKIMESQRAEIYVIEHNNQIIATGKLIIEYKLHNNFTNMGHIEDLVVHNEFRGKGLGKLITDFLHLRAKELMCYKVILNCSTENVEFYKKCGFKQKGVEMAMYYM
jgi:glucosamine-phosphate N-acetyltransferase